MASVTDKLLQMIAGIDDPHTRSLMAGIVSAEIDRAMDRKVDQYTVSRLDTDMIQAEATAEQRKRTDHAFEQIDNTNEAIIVIAGTLKELKTGLEHVIAVTEGGAAEIKKVLSVLAEHGDRLGKLENGQVVFTNRLEELDQRHGQQWEDIRERLDRDEKRLDQKRAELDELQTFVAYLRGRMLSDEEQEKLFADYEQLKRDVAELKRQAGHDSA